MCAKPARDSTSNWYGTYLCELLVLASNSHESSWVILWYWVTGCVGTLLPIPSRFATVIRASETTHYRHIIILIKRVIRPLECVDGRLPVKPSQHRCSFSWECRRICLLRGIFLGIVNTIRIHRHKLVLVKHDSTPLADFHFIAK